MTFTSDLAPEQRVEQFSKFQRDETKVRERSMVVVVVVVVVVV